MSPPKYVDLLLLLSGLAVFLVAGFPMLGYAVAAGVWVLQRLAQAIVARRAAQALAEGSRQRAMGMIAATTLGRVWIMALAVLLVGLGDREAGLAAAILVAAMFTVSFAAQGISHLFEPQRQGAVRRRAA